MCKWFFAPILGIGTVCLAASGSSAGATQALLEKLVSEKYLELYDVPNLELSGTAIDEFRQDLEVQRKVDLLKIEQEQSELKVRDDAARQRLEKLNKLASVDTPPMRAERGRLHCEILQTEQTERELQAERQFGLQFIYDNKLAKLDLIRCWALRRRQIDQEVAGGHGRDRRHGDVDDIGIRRVGEGQAKDIDIGVAGRREMRARGYLISELTDRPLREYVQKLAQTIAASSDLRVPVHVSLFASNEINAFGVPGGFLFVNAGLIAGMDHESELAGVLAHEIAHIAARHGNKLTRGVSVRNVFSEGVQAAANAFSGGAFNTAQQYAREYGIFGLGLTLNLKLLGVSPDCEAEADQLGIQYVWRAGFDPRGLLAFYDKMASETQYRRSASFFRTHPPYGEAALASFCELEYLPRLHPKPDTPAFAAAKNRLARLIEKDGDGMRQAAAPEDASDCEAGGSPL